MPSSNRTLSRSQEIEVPRKYASLGFRVVECQLRAGILELLSQPKNGLPIAALTDLYRAKKPEPAALRAALESPGLPETWQRWLEQRLSAQDQTTSKVVKTQRSRASKSFVAIDTGRFRCSLPHFPTDANNESNHPNRRALGGSPRRTTHPPPLPPERPSMSAPMKTLVLFALFASASSSVFGQGVFLTGVGAVNRSMGGAATAAPIDAMGALHWNPATISGLQCNEIAFSAEVLLLDGGLTAGGVTSSPETGVLPIPAMGWVHHIEGTNDTIGLGLYTFAGFAQNLPAVAGNPILDPASPLSPLYSDAQFFQIVPTFSRAVTDRLSIGFAPTFNLARIEFDPILFGPAAFGPGAGTRWSWGIGAQLGVYYMHSDTTHFGFSIKSPQWFEEFRTHTVVAGAPAVSKLQVDLPMIISCGMSYTGVPDWTFALDLRYFDYENTDGFGKPDIFGSELNWKNVFAVALGAQRRVHENLYVRAGYTYNTSPIDAGTIGVNFATPLYQQHVIGVGASYRFADGVDFTLSYNQTITAEQSGLSPIFGPLSSQVATYSLAAAITVRYGN